MNARVDITPRKPKFDFSDIDRKWFWDDNSLLTAFFVALSATFPDGERFFLKSVRQYKDQIKDPVLAAQVKDFTSQEGQHAIQHTEVDMLMEELGLCGMYIEKDFRVWIENLYDKMSPEQRLARTVCIEHLTALLADYELNTNEFDNLPTSIRALMEWHAIEELEHKAVAFDVYMACVGDRNLLRKEMLRGSYALTTITTRYQLHILRQNRHLPSAAEWKGFMAFNKGMQQSIRRGWLDFFKADFHPWQEDNSALVEAWKQKNPAIAQATV